MLKLELLPLALPSPRAAVAGGTGTRALLALAAKGLSRERRGGLASGVAGGRQRSSDEIIAAPGGEAGEEGRASSIAAPRAPEARRRGLPLGLPAEGSARLPARLFRELPIEVPLLNSAPITPFGEAGLTAAMPAPLAQLQASGGSATAAAPPAFRRPCSTPAGASSSGSAAGLAASPAAAGGAAVSWAGAAALPARS